jgi:hypothetical protein
MDDSTNDIIRSKYNNLEAIPQIISFGGVNSNVGAKI